MTFPDFNQRQRRFLDDDADAKLLVAGRQSGKTEMALYEAVRAASDGLDVAYYIPTHSMGKDLSKKVKASVAKATQSRLNIVELRNGNTITFLKSSDRMIRDSSFDVLVFDDVASLGPTTHQKIINLANQGKTIYAVTTPVTMSMDITDTFGDAGFSITTLHTMDNPAVASAATDTWIDHLSDQSPETLLIESSTRIGGHELHLHDDEDYHEWVCYDCGLSVDAPKDAPNSTKAMLELYVYGEAKTEKCK